MIETGDLTYTEMCLPQLQQALNYEKIYRVEALKASNEVETYFIIVKNGKQYCIDCDETINLFISENLTISPDSLIQVVLILEIFMTLKQAELASVNEKVMELVNVRFKFKSRKDACIEPENVKNLSIYQKEGTYILKAYLHQNGTLMHYEVTIGKDNSFVARKLSELVLFYNL